LAIKGASAGRGFTVLPTRPPEFAPFLMADAFGTSFIRLA